MIIHFKDSCIPAFAITELVPQPMEPKPSSCARIMPVNTYTFPARNSWKELEGCRSTYGARFQTICFSIIVNLFLCLTSWIENSNTQKQKKCFLKHCQTMSHLKELQQIPQDRGIIDVAISCDGASCKSYLHILAYAAESCGILHSLTGTIGKKTI